MEEKEKYQVGGVILSATLVRGLVHCEYVLGEIHFELDIELDAIEGGRAFGDELKRICQQRMVNLISGKTEHDNCPSFTDIDFGTKLRSCF